MSENITITPSQRGKKQLIKFLAIKLGFPNTTRYIESRIDDDIARHLTAEEIERFLGDEAFPKTGSGRRAKKQAAS